MAVTSEGGVELLQPGQRRKPRLKETNTLTFMDRLEVCIPHRIVDAQLSRTGFKAYCGNGLVQCPFVDCTPHWELDAGIFVDYACTALEGLR